MKRRIKSQISLFLLMLVSMGLAISTLHSHHHLEWNHSQDFPDTGHCLSVDTAVCPITGYIFETDILADSHTGKTFFESTEIIIKDDFRLHDSSISANRGRSPPALV